MRRFGPLVAALLVGLTAAPAGAQVSAPSVSRVRLANGLTVLVRENPTAPVVAISLMVKMGTRWETADTAGISNLVQVMAVRGTPTRTGTQIVEQADAMGGSIEATGDVDASEIAATALARHWVEMLDLVADIALHPTMPEGVVQAVRDFLIRQLRNRGDKPYDVAFDTLTARLFGRHPYAWDPIGLKESLERLDRPALLAHYGRHYVPGGMVLAVSGRVKTAEVVAQAGRLFGAMAAGPVPVAAPAPPPPPALTSTPSSTPNTAGSKPPASSALKSGATSPAASASLRPAKSTASSSSTVSSATSSAPATASSAPTPSPSISKATASHARRLRTRNSSATSGPTPTPTKTPTASASSPSAPTSASSASSATSCKTKNSPAST